MSRSYHPANDDKARWARTRRAVLVRDGHRCQCCRARATQVDHAKPIFQGGSPWSMANLQAICSPCHRAKSRREQRPLGPRATTWEAFADELR